MTILDWGCAGAALAGEDTSGDRAVIDAFPGGAFVGLIDGLGHGRAAAEAARVAEQVFRTAPSAPVTELLSQCHEKLRGTRGAVMTIAQFDAARNTMTWLAVGNVEGLLIRSGGRGVEAVAQRGGTVGYLLPPMTPRTLDVERGDTLVFATDGIRHGFKNEVVAARAPQCIADEILKGWSTAKDDALVIVARYEGAA